MTEATYQTSAPQIAHNNPALSRTIQAPPPAKNRTWKGPRALPASLAHEVDWPIYVLWRYGSTPNGKGKYPKIPFSPHKVAAPDKKRGYTYKGAKTDTPSTWGTFAECIAAALDWPGWFDGVGRVLQPGEVGIDGDDCIDVTGQIADYMALALADATGYKETSVSQTGAHIIVEGQLAEVIKTDAIEIYSGGVDKGRFFVLTGDELPGSSRPAPSQALVDRLVKTYGSARKQAGQKPAATLCQVETVALTPELASDVTEATKRLPALLADLQRGGMTRQLADLLHRNVFPPAMKDTSASGARAVVVAQLHRAPRRPEAPQKPRYSDAQIYAMAREIWRCKGYEGAIAGKERALSGDCWRLIAEYRPGAPARTKRAYKPAPEPLAYLARMAEEAASGAVLLNRDERAALASVPRATAQRTEEKLVAEGLVELATYALTGPGTKGRSGMLRITAAGWKALGRQDESVILTSPPLDEQVTDTAPQCAKPQSGVGKNTVCGDRAVCVPGAPAHPPSRVLPSPPFEPEPVVWPATVDEPPMEPLDEWAEAEAWLTTGEGARLLARVERHRVDEATYNRIAYITRPALWSQRPPGEGRYSVECLSSGVWRLWDDEVGTVLYTASSEAALWSLPPGYQISRSGPRVALVRPSGNVSWYDSRESATVAARVEYGPMPEEAQASPQAERSAVDELRLVQPWRRPKTALTA